jgi:hypothetical protein
LIRGGTTRLVEVERQSNPDKTWKIANDEKNCLNSERRPLRNPRGGLIERDAFFKREIHMYSFKTLFLIGYLSVGLAWPAGTGHADDAQTIQAQAFGVSTMAGVTFGITIYVESFSTPADQKALIDAYKQGGHDEMVKVLSKMPSKGRVRLSSGGVGYQINYIREIPTANGRTLRLLTDRPINIGEAMYGGRSKDYDISIIELQLSKDESKSTGSLIPGARIRTDKKKQQIEIESFHAAPWRLAGIMER